MTEKTLLRLAIVLQNQAPSTLNKYICKFVESILFDYPDGLDLFDLSRKLFAEFNLSFTEEEIAQAVNKKGQNHIILVGNIYKLTQVARSKLVKQTSLTDELTDIIRDFVAVNSFDISIDTVSSLLLRYFYYCFNSNVDNLLSLFENRVVGGANSFEANADEITIINNFISWENPHKNTLVYSIIATCYEYCMLTIKKDRLLSKELFKGKRFYLDANIIFRMAGINNEERKMVTQGFIDQCRQIGIELYCTTATLDEVYRVIGAQIGYIKGITGLSMPVSCEQLERINPNTEINDFYRIYYNWCKTPGNKYGDFPSFNQHLLSLVQETFSQLKISNSASYKLGSESAKFTQHVDSLKQYKNTLRTCRHKSTLSAETDINNIMDVISWRTGTGSNIWQTNDFIVSADQLLIGWSNDTYSGVPIVVLPSVWLSIILRFTGRTDDDYKSFCLFLTQRYHKNADEMIDPIQLLTVINEKTSQTNIKERIISEIVQNKSQYVFITPDDYAKSTDQAFDRVLEEVYGNTEQQISKAREEMQRQIDDIKKEASEKATEVASIQAAVEREKTIITLAKRDASDRVRPFRNISDFSWILYVLAAVIVALALASWIWEINPLYSWMTNLLPQKATDSTDVVIAIWGIFTLVIGLLATAAKKFINYLASERREDKLYHRYYKKLSKAFEQ